MCIRYVSQNAQEASYNDNNTNLYKYYLNYIMSTLNYSSSISSLPSMAVVVISALLIISSSQISAFSTSHTPSTKIIDVSHSCQIITAAISFQQLQQQHNRCHKSSILYMSDNLDDFDDDLLSDSEEEPLNNVDDIGSRAVANTGLSSGGYQTEGGVIMPEGGANPCVIKVCIMFFFLIFIEVLQ